MARLTLLSKRDSAMGLRRQCGSLGDPPPRFIEARPFLEGVAAVAEPWRTNRHYIQSDGKAAFAAPPASRWVSDFRFGLAAYQCSDTEHYGVIDRSGKIIQPCTWIDVCTADGTTMVGFLGRPNHNPITFEPRCISRPGYRTVTLGPSPPPRGYQRRVVHALADDSFSWAVLGKADEPRLVGKLFDSFRVVDEGYIIAEGSAGSAVFSAQGRMVVAWQPQKVVNYGEGIAIIEAPQPARPIPVPSSALEFAAAPCAARFGAMNAHGRILLAPVYPYLGRFSEGVAPACELGDPLDPGPYCKRGLSWCGYIDKQGQHAISVPGSNIYPPNSFSKVLNEDGWHSWYTHQALIDWLPGHGASAPFLGSFHDGVASVSLLAQTSDRRFGALTRSGHWLLTPRFSALGRFTKTSDGVWLAPAQSVEKGYRIDHQGQMADKSL